MLDTHAAPFTAPWTMPLDHRLATLKRRGTRIAYHFQSPDTASFRYRAYNMVQVINACSTTMSASFFFEHELEQLDAVLDAIDVLVVPRAHYTDRINRLITRARNLGRSVAYDIDDLVFDPDYVPMLIHTLGLDVSEPGMWNRWFGDIARIGVTMKLCDRVLVTNDTLAGHATRYAGIPAYVAPNFLNQEQMAVSSRLFAQKHARRFRRDGTLHLGYFSGSGTHDHDCAIIAGVLARLLEEHAHLRLRIVGPLTLDARLQKFAERIERHALVDFLDLQRLIAAVEINLAPLQNNAFTNCKSDLKYFEAAIVGTVTIASPTAPLRAAITQGQTGFLARSTEWYAALSRLIASPETLADIATRAFSDARQRYAWSVQLPAIEQALFGSGPSRSV